MSAGRAELDRLLAELLDHPEREDEIARRIDERFARDRAVMVLDMSGFSRTTQRLGIVPFLAMIRQMQRLAAPCIGAAHGRLVKAEADNLFCVFDTVDAAVAASREIVARLTAENERRSDDRRLYVSIGIGYGRILDLDDDLFGDELNLASKLGEDIGGMGDVLLTSGAKAHLQSAVALKEHSVSVSGLTLTYYRVP